jgi:hypothetical protein
MGTLSLSIPNENTDAMMSDASGIANEQGLSDYLN